MHLETFLPARTSPFDPPEVLKELRHNQPVAKTTLWNGKQAWLITKHTDACSVLTDRRFSADTTHENLPVTNRGQTIPLMRPNIARVDDPKHAQLRRAVSPEFLPKRIDNLRSVVQRIVDTRIDGMLQSNTPVDLIAALARVVPSRTIAHLLGVPEEDMPEFQRRVEIFNTRESTIAESQAADAALFHYVDELVIRKKHRPTDDVLGRLAALHKDDLTHDELVNMALILISAGLSTTGKMIGLGVLSLLTDSALFSTVRERPDLVPKVVEELLRYHTILHHGLRRVAIEDVIVSGTLIKAGDGVIVMLSSSNRDGEVFTDPDHINIHRDTRQHIAFGHGPHVCLGRPLARLELRIVLHTLTNRIPTLRLAVPVDKLTFEEGSHQYAVNELPVSW